MTPRQHAGLTLIEVLIALAIVGIAMTAVIKATSQTIRATDYLQTKTVATWAAQEVMNEIRVHMITLPNAPDKLKQTNTLLGRDWYVEAEQAQTPNKRIYKINVNVYTREKVDEETPVVSLESYVYHTE